MVDEEFTVMPALWMGLPALPLPEITLRAAGVLPPMRLPAAASSRIPSNPLGRAMVPVGSVPMKVPWMVQVAAELRKMPVSKCSTANPRMVLPLPPLSMSNAVQPTHIEPSSSIRITASSPSESVFWLAPGCW